MTRPARPARGAVYDLGASIRSLDAGETRKGDLISPGQVHNGFVDLRIRSKFPVPILATSGAPDDRSSSPGWPIARVGNHNRSRFPVAFP